MLNTIFTIFRINIILSLSIITLSFLTIIWHNQSYLLYKKTKATQKDNQKIIALHKQLLSQYSEQISGNIIKKKAFDVLKMKMPTKITKLTL